MLVFGLQVAMAPWQWTREWAYLAPALIACSLIWIVLLALIALAVSAWVKWRIVASAATFGAFMISAGFAEMVNNILRTEWGSLFSLSHLMTIVQDRLLSMPPGYVFGLGREPMPLHVAFNGLAIACVAALFVLQKRLRACEVVRG
jgi:ABC-2 type transport system permease protein